jgi:hypothetical protein
MSLERLLLAIEEQFWTGGPAIYHRHADDRCLVVFAEMAKILSRDDIADTAGKGRWKKVSLKPKALLELNDGVAILSYEGSAERKDGKPYRAHVSSGYVKRPDGWKLAFHQQTPLP